MSAGPFPPWRTSRVTAGCGAQGKAEWLKPRKSSTGSNLADMGRDAVRDLRCQAGSTLALVGFADEEATVKDCGVAVAMLPGQELGA